MKNTSSARGWVACLMSFGVALASGCLPPQRGAVGGGGVPGSRTHVQAPAAVAPISTPQQLQTLLSELRTSELPVDAAYLAPEQIVAMAVAELGQGNPWDAALLLNVATYRYRQQARLAERLGDLEVQDRNQDVARVYRLQAMERRILNRDMLEAVRLLRSRLRVLPAASGAQPDAAPETALAGASLAPAVEPNNLGEADERVAHPELAQAFLARLLADGDKGGVIGRLMLETSPLVAFRRAALPGVREFHPRWLVPDTMSQQAALRDDLIAALRDSRPATRSAAGFVLGAVKDVSAQGELRAALSREQDPRTTVSLQVALSQLGDDTQLASLEQEAQVTNSEVSALTLTLMGALPKRLLERVQPEILSALMLDKKPSFTVRANAATLLGIVAQARPLPEAQVAALLQVCASGKADLAEIACGVLGGLKQLERERLLLLLTQYPGARAGLYQRWAETAEEADLPALDHEFEAARSNQERKPECAALVRAAGRIAGGAATERLSNWYVRVEDRLAAVLLAAELSRRPDVTEAAREALLARVGAPKRLLLRVGAGDPRAKDDAAALAKQHDYGALFDAAYLTGEPKIPAALSAPLLWQLARYHDSSIYPADLGVRWAAVNVLFQIAVLKLPGPPAQPINN